MPGAPVAPTKDMHVNPAGKGFPIIQPPYKKSGFYCTFVSVVLVVIISLLLVVPALVAAELLVVLVGVVIALVGVPVFVIFVYLKSFMPPANLYTKILERPWFPTRAHCCCC